MCRCSACAATNSLQAAVSRSRDSTSALPSNSSVACCENACVIAESEYVHAHAHPSTHTLSLFLFYTALMLLQQAPFHHAHALSRTRTLSHTHSLTHADAQKMPKRDTASCNRVTSRRSASHTQYDVFIRDMTYRVAKAHRIPYLSRSFSTKVTYI